MQVKKQQLELDMEQQTGSKLGKEYIKAVYCHPAYLTSMQSTSWGFPHSSVGKESTCNAEDPSLIPGLGRSAEEGIGYSPQCKMLGWMNNKLESRLLGEISTTSDMQMISL